MSASRIVRRFPIVLSGLALALLLPGAPVRAQGTTRVSVDSAGGEANFGADWVSISADGRFVAFQSDSTNLVANDTNGVTDVFVHDRVTGTTERVSVDSSGAQADDLSVMPALSADGNRVAFASLASNLVAGDTNALADVFVHDRTTGLTERVSVDTTGVEGDGGSGGPVALSIDGRFVAFVSAAANFDPNDTNGTSDVYLHDCATGLTERISTTPKGDAADDGSSWPSISADGQVVAFHSYATNLVAGDSNGSVDVFVRDRSTGTTERVSVSTHGTQANGSSFAPSISADGQLVAFESYASNLVAGDANTYEDVFVRDRSNVTTELVSVDSSGTFGNYMSLGAAISADGTHVAFCSLASNLVAGDANGTFDVFVHSAGLTELVSVDSTGVQGNDVSAHPWLSADGEVVAFDSTASNLVAGDGNAAGDIFVAELCATDATWTNYGAGFAGTNGVPSITSQTDPVLGTTLQLDVANSYGKPTSALLFVGYQRASIHSSLGGDLLVIPAFTLPLAVPKDGASLLSTLPRNAQLCGFVIDLQALESDPGAAKGVSFTPGLELVLGH